MRGRWLYHLGLAAALGSPACERETESVREMREPDMVPPAEETYRPPPFEAKADQPPDPPETRITVVNPFPYAMTITATHGDETVLLGAIDAKVTGGFYIQAPPGTTVRLRARGPQGVEGVERTITVNEEPVVWTLGE